MLKFDYRKVKLDDNFKIHYDDEPFEICIKYVPESHHLKRNVYLQILSIGLSGLIWKKFATMMNLTNEKNKKLNIFADLILVAINCDLKLPLDKIIYFYDLIIQFNCDDKIA